ncbi:LPP20 family lipoprotein [Thiomicrorhabdus sp.]|uniref:LPP20 family lipoprotein n=1 Tax=Thiomicrorhabdus sp. TaxID=2039724 RepID=UPI0029C7B6FF|nr:LPP20 family lipoprotein [Thiomicrorhabdus sp.]
MKRTWVFALFAGVALSGCALTESMVSEGSGAVQASENQASVQVKQSVMKVTEVSKPELIKITGIGYGAEDTYGGYTTGQRRLLAIRSSKLDAYRSLAEQLYGIKIDSTTTVATLTAKNDSFRARVNALVRGARVVSVTPMADQNYETIMEVYVDKHFFEEAFVYRSGSLAASEAERVYKVSSYE